MDIINSLALPVMLLLAFGVMFGIVKIRSILFFLLALLLLPFFVSAISQAFGAGFSYRNRMSWQMWLIFIFIGLIILRLIIDKIFRRK